MDFLLNRTSRTTRLSMSIEAGENLCHSHSINILGPSASQPLSVQTVRANSGSAPSTLYNAAFARKLGWSHIACAALCILLGIVTLILRCQVAWLGSPLWSGLAFFLVAGIFGIAAGPNDTCTVVSFMVMSVMSSIVAFVMLIAMLVAASTEYAFCRHTCNAAYCTTVCNGQAGRISVDVLVAIVGLIECIISIMSISVSCRRTQASVSTQTVVQHFFPSSGGRVTIYTSGQNASLMTNEQQQQQNHANLPLHVYDQPSVYPVTLPGSIMTYPEDHSLPFHATAQAQPTTHPPLHTNVDTLPSTAPVVGMSHQAPYPSAAGDIVYPVGHGEVLSQEGVALPPYSVVQQDDTNTERSPPPPFTSYIIPDTELTPEGTMAYPYGTSVYSSLPPPYQASREFQNV
ncbi:uncharacterized protein LOC121416249 isoform X1 [Lytechinus variegatus]|uniref:uncharacterized protein LOC121416249 isoform X1 n=1 Tax=Lytechinus variegatus TaxID=7654 RepID=UPI001BB1F1E1|nr:uncharacterized protein LOC121416249 isoform X1 [Lytechinus variegatus]XP_041465708.1 uncharacterized protein LOC121416249 isoform X1 [Lytechinus variegatus]